MIVFFIVENNKVWEKIILKQALQFLKAQVVEKHQPMRKVKVNNVNST